MLHQLWIELHEELLQLVRRHGGQFLELFLREVEVCQRGGEWIRHTASLLVIAIVVINIGDVAGTSESIVIVVVVAVVLSQVLGGGWISIVHRNSGWSA